MCQDALDAADPADPDEGHADSNPFAHLMAELDFDEAFGNVSDDMGDSSTDKKSKAKDRPDMHDVDFDPFDRDPGLVVKQPLPGAITRSGNSIYCAGFKVGSISYLVHWTPPALAGNCAIHGQGCYYTTPLLESDEDSMVKWLGEAQCYKSAADHMRCVPPHAYYQRARRE